MVAVSEVEEDQQRRDTPQPKRWMTSGWLPGGLALAVTAAVLRFYDVPLTTTAVFVTYLVLVVTVPGVLLWRAARRGSRSFVEDLAAGAAVGYAVEVLTYIAGRAMGVPLLVLVPPVVVIAAFLAVPGLRRYWRGAGPAGRAPAGWSWLMFGAWALILFWSVKYFRIHGMHWPSYSSPDGDMPFHLALLGEAKHHMPLMTPWVSGEPVLYHWFVYAEMASASWVTGIEPMLLLTRLSMLPMLAAFAVLVSATGRRLVGTWWAGAVAAVMTFFVLAPNPYGWSMFEPFTRFGFSPIDDGSSFRLTLWTSPTQTFGALLFAPLVLVLIDLLSASGRRRRQWVLFTLLLVAVMGAKATYLPVLLAALLLVVLVHLVAKPGVHRPAVAAAGITFAGVLFAQFILFGGASQGLKLDPLAIMTMSAAGTTTGFVHDPRLWRLLLLTAITLFCWICIWGGVAGLRRRLLAEPAAVLLLGLGAAGTLAILALGHSGGSQGFFLQSARPYLCIAAVWGLATLVPRMNRRVGLTLAAAAAGGFFAVRVVRALDGTRVPAVSRARRPALVALDLMWPYAVLAGLILAVAVGLWLTRRRRSRGTAIALVVSMAAGFGLFSTYAQLSTLLKQGRSQGWRQIVMPHPFVTQGTMEAGRWLRDHSSPDDLVATNAHCAYMEGSETCYNLHFAIAAYAERRVLVEGWGFSATAHVQAAKLNVYVGSVPYWKPDVLADNGAVFNHPSDENVRKLRDKYGVRWLFVDETQGVPPVELTRYATLRYRAGPSVVYEIER